MTDLPQLTEFQIQNWVGEQSFRRGMHYFLEGMIHHPRRQGEILKAFCSGSRPEPYRVELVVNSQGIVSGDCTCPVGMGGYCKHAPRLCFSPGYTYPIPSRKRKNQKLGLKAEVRPNSSVLSTG